MAKTFRKIGDIPDYLFDVLDEATSKKALEPIAERIVKRIVDRTRSGYSVKKDGGPVKDLAALKPSTIKYRTYLKSVGQLSDLTSPNTSNLTMTGHMLDSLTWNVSGKGTIKILFSNEFASNKAAWNQEKTKYKAARPFMYLSRTEIRELENELQDTFDKYLLQRLGF